jgi:hypothetical protein
MTDEQPITPLTALIVNSDGQLTYMGQDGQRYVIVGNAELLQRLQQGEPSPGEQP